MQSTPIEAVNTPYSSIFFIQIYLPNLLAHAGITIVNLINCTLFLVCVIVGSMADTSCPTIKILRSYNMYKVILVVKLMDFF